MPEPENTNANTAIAVWRRLAAAFMIALIFGCGIYALLETIRPVSGLVSFSFLLVMPGAISAFVCYVADPLGRRSHRFYRMVPVGLGLGVIVVSTVFLREGVICILMLSPLWLGMGVAAAEITYECRHRMGNGKLYSVSILSLPLLAMAIEPVVPLPQSSRAVTRSIEIDAPAERIWPFLRGIPDVHPGEGQWNLSQDVLGIPRPLSAHLAGDGVGAKRLARWERNISFSEVITEWQIDRRIGWRFEFGNKDGWAFTDQHLRPDSAYLRITTGGYTLVPLGPDRTRLVIDTHYWMRTPVNAYSALWGELFLGDLENNLLALVKQRAER